VKDLNRFSSKLLITFVSLLVFGAGQMHVEYAEAATTSKVERCLKRVNKDFTSIPTSSRPAKVILVAAENICLVTEDYDRAVQPIMRYVNSDGKNLIKANNKSFEVSSDYVLEPGLLGLDGAEEVLRKLLKDEAEYFWKQADIIKQKQAAVKNSPYQSKQSVKKSASKHEITTDIIDDTIEKANSDSNNVTEIINEETGSNTFNFTEVTINDSNPITVGVTEVVGENQDSEENLTISNFNTTKKSGVDPDDYADAYIMLLKNNPDEGLHLKSLMYLKLLEIVHSKKRTEPEKRFMKAMEQYIQQQYEKIATTALEEYEEWEKNEEINQVKVLNTYSTVRRPPEVLDHVRNGVTLSASGLATTLMIVAYLKKATVLGAALKSAYMPYATVAVSGSTTSAAAVVAIAGLIIGIIQLETILEAEDIIKDLKKALAISKLPVSLKQMASSRDGMLVVQHMYAKATSERSPIGGYIDSKKGCQVCLYTEKNYHGNKVCLNKRVSNLKNYEYPEGVLRKLTNKASSVYFDTKDCPSAHIVAFENPRFTRDHIIIKDNISDLSLLERGKRHNWDNDISSVVFTNKAAPQCEVCMYEDPNYSGKFACTSGSIKSLHELNIGDDIESIKMNTKHCPEAKAWFYKKKELKRDKSGDGVMVAIKSIRNLNKEFRNTISSVLFSKDADNPEESLARTGCRVCLYEHDNYKGNYICTDSAIKSLNKEYNELYDIDIKLNNNITSVQIIRDNCPAGMDVFATLFSNDNLKGDELIINNSIANLGKKWNDRAGSVKFTTTKGTDTSKQCNVCLFSDVNFNGEEKCFTGEAGNFRKIGFNNKASSVKFNTQACPDGAATFYENNLKGDKAIAYKDIPDLKKIKRGKNGSWNNQMSSIKFAKDMKAKMEAAFKPLPIDPPWVN
jgi:peptidase inhibitor family I36